MPATAQRGVYGNSSALCQLFFNEIKKVAGLQKDGGTVLCHTEQGEHLCSSSISQGYPTDSCSAKKTNNPFQLITTQSRIEVQSCRNSSTYGGPYIEQGWSVPPSVELLRQDCIGILDSKQSSCNPESTRNSNDNCSTDRGPVIEQGWQHIPTFRLDRPRAGSSSNKSLSHLLIEQNDLTQPVKEWVVAL